MDDDKQPAARERKVKPEHENGPKGRHEEEPVSLADQEAYNYVRNNEGLFFLSDAEADEADRTEGSKE